METSTSEPNNASLSSPQAPPQQPPTPQPAQEKPSPTAKKPRQRKQADPKPKRTAAAPSPTAPVPHQKSPPSRTPQLPLQPYPGPPYHIMNPGYPMGNSAFTQQHQPLYPPHIPSNGASGPGMPPHQYYPMHPTYPPPHGYAYPPYQQMMVYGTPRPPGSPEMSQMMASPGAGSSHAASKRKRKNNGLKADTDDETGSDRAHSQVQPAIDMKKRTKTQRACDSCRSRKIRCDILSEVDPPICQHCKQYGFECTFFLPITETRFKKKKMEEEAAKGQEQASGSIRDTSSPYADPGSKGDAKVYGPTSATHLLHSQATISSRMLESYDLRYHHTWEVSKSGDGLIRVEKPAPEGHPQAAPKPADLHLERETIEKLLNAYFTEIAPVLPVVTQAEFLATPSPPPILLYSMCLVAAGRRSVPRDVYESLRYAMNAVIKADDVLSTSSIVNVQALLILCMMGDCHSQFVPAALSALWIRLGTAIRMAQDLGLHRAESVKQNIELRRRLWAACVISDRWTSLGFGHPYMIDVEDCDARLPSSGDPHDEYLDELVRLSVILGRVLKAIYSPSGLTHTTDDILQTLLADLEAWKKNLPGNLTFQGPQTPRNAGLLHMLYSCVCMIFWRVFMRISYTCPAHLKFAMTIENWHSLVALTGETIDWLDAHEDVYDVWFVVAYCATSCALVQYHTWARQMGADAVDKLRKLRDCVRRWESASPLEHMSARRKTAEIISLLYEATQGPPLPAEGPVLNPTGGVTANPPATIQYRKDPSRPGGGVFVAHSPTRARDYESKGVPAGTVINSSDEEDEGEDPGNAVSPVARADDHALLLSPSPFAPPPRANDLPSAATGRISTGDAVARQAGVGTPTSPTPMVTLTPLTGGSAITFRNVNPAMNERGASVQVMNALETPQASNTLEQLALADTGLLEGIPGSMFDWGQWEMFFARLNHNMSENGGNGGMPVAQTPA